METATEQLRTILQDIAKKEKYEFCKIDIKPISSEGANYTTDLFLAKISEPLKPDLHIFAKAANLNEAARKSNEMLANVYETEATFYSVLAVEFERIYNKHQVPKENRLVLPKHYGHVLIPYKEIMLLENLEARGFRNFDRMKTFDWEYAATAVTQLAKFHSLGLAIRYENPQEYEKNVSNFVLNPWDELMTNTFLRMSLENGCEGLNADQKKRLLGYFTFDGTVQAPKEMQKFMENKAMLVHGDFRPSNLMHRTINGKLEVIILDYQTLRMGSPVADLMHFIFSGSDEEFRRLHYQRLLDHYFTQLSLALKQVNVDVENVYPKKTYEAELVEAQPLGLFIGVIMAAMVTVAPEDAPKLEGDLSSMQVKPNKLAQERIQGVVDDFIRWGVL